MTVIGDLVTRFTADLSGLEKGVGQYGSEIDKAKGKTSEMEKGTGGLNTGLVNLASGLFVVEQALGWASRAYDITVGKTLAYAKAVEDAATITGISTDNIQRWRAAAIATGTNVDSLTISMRFLTQNLENYDDKTSDIRNKLNALGVTVKDTNGKFRDTSDLMWDIIDALGAMPDIVERNKLAMQLFGKSWSELASLMKDAQKAKDAFNAADPIAEKQIKELREYNIKLDEMGSKWDHITYKVTSFLIPALERVVGLLDDIVDPARQEKLNSVFYSMTTPTQGDFQRSVALMAQKYGSLTPIKTTSTNPNETKENVLRKSLDEEIQINLFAIQDYLTSIETKKQLNEDYADDKKELDKRVAETEVQINASKNQSLKDLWKNLKTNIETNPVKAFIDIQAGIQILKGASGGDTIPAEDDGWAGKDIGSKDSEMYIFMTKARAQGYTYQQALNMWGTGDTGDVLKKKAMGGPVSANMPYLVGENGPEIFSPDQNGTILPNGMTGGTCNITVELDGEVIAQKIAAPLVGEIRVRTGVRF